MSDSFSSNLQAHPRPFKNSLLTAKFTTMGSTPSMPKLFKVHIEYITNSKYNTSITTEIIYGQRTPLPIHQIIAQIMSELNEIDQSKFYHFLKIKEESFTNKEVTNNTLRNFTKLITEYDIDSITAKGLHIVVGDLSMPINIQCPRNNKYDQNLEWVIPYDFKAKYQIRNLLKEILDFINNENKPMKFIITKVDSASFLATEMSHNDYDWNNLNADITNYSKIELSQTGLTLEIDIDAYTLTYLVCS